MARKLKALKDGDVCRLNMVLSRDLARRVEAKRKRLAEATPGAMVTRSDVVRMALHAFIDTNTERESK